MAELLAVGSTAASSADFTVAAGTKAVLALKAEASGQLPASAQVTVDRKDAAGVYTVVDKLNLDNAMVVIDNASANALTFRVTRAGGFACGVDQV